MPTALVSYNLTPQYPKSISAQSQTPNATVIHQINSIDRQSNEGLRKDYFPADVLYRP
jgi:hypothetical protein